MLTWEEISVAPGAGTMLARLANQVARQNGLDASTVRAKRLHSWGMHASYFAAGTRIVVQMLRALSTAWGPG